MSILKNYVGNVGFLKPFRYFLSINERILRRIASWIPFFKGGFVFLPPSVFCSFSSTFRQIFLVLFFFIFKTASIFLFYPLSILMFLHLFQSFLLCCFFWQFLLAIVGFSLKRLVFSDFYPLSIFTFLSLFLSFFDSNYVFWRR